MLTALFTEHSRTCTLLIGKLRTVCIVYKLLGKQQKH